MMGWVRTFQVASILFIVTTVIGVWSGSTSTGFGAVNGLSLVVAVVAGVVLLARRIRSSRRS